MLFSNIIILKHIFLIIEYGIIIVAISYANGNQMLEVTISICHID